MINSRMSAIAMALGCLLVTACATTPGSSKNQQQNISKLTVDQAQDDARLPLSDDLDANDGLSEEQATAGASNADMQPDDAQSVEPTTGESPTPPSDEQSNSARGQQPGLPVDMSDALYNVVWGGTIARVSNQADGSTIVEIVSRPLYEGGRPKHDDQTDGRFLAHIDEFLDPEIVQEGRDMTVVGYLSQRVSGKIGESAYVFPVVEAVQHRYWKATVKAVPQHFPHWNDYPYYGRFGSYDPFWRRSYPYGGYYGAYNTIWRDWPYRTRVPKRHRAPNRR